MAFVAATVILILIPGPAVSLIIANSLAYGARRTLITVAGIASATIVHLSVLALGMTSLMLLLSESFTWLRWAGVVYLIYLGWRQFRTAPEALDAAAANSVSLSRLYWQGFIVNVTNPKVLFFYAAFFPQFLDPQLPPGPQLALLCGSFLAIATVIDSGYALLGGHLRGYLQSRRAARWRARITGGFLVSAGIGLALARRS